MVDSGKNANKVEVVISGEVFTLIADENETYIHQLARYIDKKTNEILTSKSNANINPATRSLLLAINIADDLFKEKQKNNAPSVNDSSIDRLTQENKELFERVQSLQQALDDTKRELSEYLEVFDSVTPRIKPLTRYKGR